MSLRQTLRRFAGEGPAAAPTTSDAASPQGADPDEAGIQSQPPIPVPSRSRRLGLPPLLLRWKLTIFYSAVLALMLSTFSILVYWYMSRSMQANLRQASENHFLTAARALESELKVSRLALTNPISELARQIQSDLRMEQVLENARIDGVAIRIYHANGRLVFGTSPFVKDLEKVPFDSAILLSARQGRSHEVVLATAERGLPLYSYSRPYFLAGQTAPLAVIEVLTNLQSFNETKELLARLLILGTLLGTALAFVLGAAVAEAALRPIDAVTRTAQQIVSRRDLARRIDDSGPQDEMGRLISTFNGMLQQIQGMFDRQQRFLADVSHELRTPLTTIRGEADLMSRAQRLDPEGLQGILSESERMSRLVEDLLLLARNDAAADLERRPVDLAELLQDLARQGALLGGEGHQVRLVAAPALSVLGDRDRLKQLLLNLISNAIRHTPAGTEVSLDLAKVGDEAQIRVSDTGQGIAPEDLPYLFDRFYKADRSRRRQSQADSTGLGLAIVQSIARAHGGWVEVASRPGLGTTFTVHLPAEGDALAPAAASDSAAPKRRGGTVEPALASAGLSPSAGFLPEVKQS